MPSNDLPPQEQLYATDGSFASSSAEAQERYKNWRSVDPFPDTEAALLNSGDIADYVSATGMIYPFYPEEEKLKVASYEVNLLGKCVRFSGEERDTSEVSLIRKGDIFVLGKNEIAFVQLEPEFRIPNYIALRFNLRITHVYRGLLLGTGPLVDPGFTGRLWIPLHNLTANNYVLRGGEGLVWMEFTKVSRLQPSTDESAGQKFFHGFQEEKNERTDIMDYLEAADPHRAIRSSIPVLFEKATQQATEARESAEKAASLIRRLGYATALALAAIVFTSWQLMTSVRDRAEEALQRVGIVELQLRQLTEADKPTEEPTPELELLRLQPPSNGPAAGP